MDTPSVSNHAPGTDVQSTGSQPGAITDANPVVAEPERHADAQPLLSVQIAVVPESHARHAVKVQCRANSVVAEAERTRMPPPNGSAASGAAAPAASSRGGKGRKGKADGKGRNTNAAKGKSHATSPSLVSSIPTSSPSATATGSSEKGSKAEEDKNGSRRQQPSAPQPPHARSSSMQASSSIVITPEGIHPLTSRHMIAGQAVAILESNQATHPSSFTVTLAAGTSVVTITLSGGGENPTSIGFVPVVLRPGSGIAEVQNSTAAAKSSCLPQSMVSGITSNAVFPRVMLHGRESPAVERLMGVNQAANFFMDNLIRWIPHHHRNEMLRTVHDVQILISGAMRSAFRLLLSQDIGVAGLQGVGVLPEILLRTMHLLACLFRPDYASILQGVDWASQGMQQTEDQHQQVVLLLHALPGNKANGIDKSKYYSLL